MQRTPSIADIQAQVESLKQTLIEEKQRNQRLQEQLQNSQQGWSGTWEMDLVSKKVVWSEEIYHLLKIAPGVKADMRLFKDRLPPASLDKLNGAISKTFVDGKDYSFEHNIQVIDEVLTVRTDLKPLYNDQRVPIKLAGRLTDITRTKSAQKEIEKLSLIAAQTSNAVVMLNIEAEIDWVNGAFTIMTGYRPDEVTGRLFDELIAGEHRKCCKDLFEEAFKTTHSLIRELQITTKRGNRKIWVVMNASAVLDYELNPESYILIMTDITDRRESEIQLALKNREIMDSIRYARRLQDAMLPGEDSMKEHFSDSFVLYRPKDIVSGDFYWMRSPGDLVFLSVADCTGHGVPGAFVSLIGNRGLNQSIEELGLKEPGVILDKLNEIIEENFNAQTGAAVRDGMDIALLAFDFSGMSVRYAGANNPLYHVRDGKLTELKPNKQPIGIHENRQPFRTHTVNMRTGDVFYIFSDGFADQFGGPHGKKFKYGAFRKTLIDHHRLPMMEQAAALEKTFTAWMGNSEQVDDVCVIGVRI